MTEQDLETVNLLNKRSEEWGKLVGQLSHLLNTQLATLRIKEAELKQHIPSFLHQYKLLAEDKTTVKPDAYFLDNIEFMINLSEQITPATELLNQVNIYIHELFANSNQLISARDCLESCLTDYSFTQDNQRALVQFDLGLDYQFRASHVIAKSLLEYLLTIALWRITKIGQGTINITSSLEGNKNLLNFKITGLSLSQQEENDLFNSFIFMNKGQIKFGLGFFRLALWHREGNITCHSVPGEYTHFTLCFG